jgi:phage terminase small subunit
MRDKLTGKQAAFVDQYFLCNFNGTEAAARAGYAGDRDTLAEVASQNLRNLKIKAAIEEAIAAIMPKGEVIQRLAAHARGSMADYMDASTATLNLVKAEEAGKLDLIKKFTRTESEKSTHVGIELYDAQAALEKLGRYHGLFTDRVEHTGAIGTYTVDIDGDDDSSTP